MTTIKKTYDYEKFSTGDRPSNKKHIELLGRSMTGKWNAKDKAATEKSLESFEGIELARELFKHQNARKWKCCICGCDFFDRTGCNPDPVVPIKETGEMPVCCPTCNTLFVLPARFGYDPIAVDTARSYPAVGR